MGASNRIRTGSNMANKSKPNSRLRLEHGRFEIFSSGYQSLSKQDLFFLSIEYDFGSSRRQTSSECIQAMAVTIYSYE